MSIAFPETISGESEIDYQCIHVKPTSSAVESPAVKPEVDLNAINGAVRTILMAVGEDPDRDGLLDTPRRVANMYAEMFSGLYLDPGRHLDVTFEESYDEIVLVRDIEFTSMCEHHLLPF
jgi:GTP cyclohydrolase IA